VRVPLCIKLSPSDYKEKVFITLLARVTNSLHKWVGIYVTIVSYFLSMREKAKTGQAVEEACRERKVEVVEERGGGD